MPYEDNKISKLNHGEKSLKAPFFISFDSEVLLSKMLSSQNNLEKSCTERKAKHIPSGYACKLICSFEGTNMVIPEEKTVLNGFVKSLKSLHWKQSTTKKKKWYS